MTRDQVLEQIRHAHAYLVAVLADIPDDVMGRAAMWERVAIQFIEDYRRDGLPVSLGLKDDAAIDVYNKRGAALRRDYTLANADIGSV